MSVSATPTMWLCPPPGCVERTLRVVLPRIYDRRSCQPRTPYGTVLGPPPGWVRDFH